MHGGSLLLMSNVLLTAGFVTVWAVTRSVVIATVISLARVTLTGLVIVVRHRRSRVAAIRGVAGGRA